MSLYSTDSGNIVGNHCVRWACAIETWQGPDSARVARGSARGGAGLVSMWGRKKGNRITTTDNDFTNRLRSFSPGQKGTCTLHEHIGTNLS